LCETDDKQEFLFPKQRDLNIPEPILAYFFEDFLTLNHQLGALLLARVVIHAFCFYLQKVIEARASHARRVPHFRGGLHLQFCLQELIPDLIIAPQSEVRAILALESVTTRHSRDLKVIFR